MTNLAFQLFSARNTELTTALNIVANAGYSSVEAYSENFNDVNLFRQSLENEGLTLSSAHVGLDELENNLAATMELMTSFNCKHIVCPFLLPENRPATIDGWTKLAKKLHKISDELNSNDFSFAWHNHDFEFVANDDGSVPIQVLLEHAPNMLWEMDIGWTVRFGADPALWINQYASRISAFHLKDLAAVGEKPDEDGWADVGFGVVDWQQLLNDIKTVKTELYVLEHDNPSDLKRFAENSFNTVKGWGLS